MDDTGLGAVEQGLALQRARATVLASDVANAHTNGYQAHDIEPQAVLTPSGVRFAAQVKQLAARGTSLIERAMGATAQVMVTYRALAAQERAILREFHTVIDEAKR